MHRYYLYNQIILADADVPAIENPKSQRRSCLGWHPSRSLNGHGIAFLHNNMIT